MKKAATILLAIFLLTAPTPSHALFGIGDIVFDPTAFAKQILQYAEEAKSAIELAKGSDIAYVLNPIANQLAASLLKQFQADTLRWINTGFQGGGPAYVLNPDAYFKNVANREIERQIIGIQAQSGIFSNSVIGTVIQTVRTGRAPTSQQLQYTLGSTIQQSVCTDANLTAMATQAVDGGGLSVVGNNQNAPRAQQISDRKRELSNQLCSQSAFAQASLQKNLATCFATNFNCGGWNAWLDLTTNPNNTAYGQITAANKLVADAAIKKQEQARGELVNGLMPKKKCTKFVELTAADYEDNPSLTPDTAPCLEEQVEVPAAAVADRLQAANQTDIHKTENSTTFGSVISSLITSSMVNLFYKSFQNPTSGNNRTNVADFTIQNNRVGFGGSGFGTTATTTQATSSDQTLPTTLAGLLQTLNDTSATLGRIKTLLDGEVTLLTSYKSDLASLNACYDTLSTKSNASTYAAEISSGKQYIATATASNLSSLSRILSDQAAVPAMSGKVTSWISYVQQSGAVADVSVIAAQYAEAVGTRTIFDRSKEISLQDESSTLTSAINDDRTQNLKPKMDHCQLLLQGGTGGI